MKFYLLGIPTDPDLLKPDLVNFVTHDTPTLYLHQLNRSIRDIGTVTNGYNFFTDYDFDQRRLQDISSGQQIGARTICALPKEQLRYNDNEHLIAADQAQRLQAVLENLATQFPTTRIVFVTLGNCFTFYEYLTRLLEHDSGHYFEIINTENFVDHDINCFSKISAVLGYQMHRPHYQPVYPPQDRLGVFFEHGQQLDNYYTDKTFEQIVDETAVKFANSRNLVAWSGGIDSTMVLAAFVKNQIPFEFTVSPGALKENTALFDYLKTRYSYVELDSTVNMQSIDSAYTVVTGDCADQLYPGIWHNFVLGAAQFKEVIGKTEFDQSYRNYFETDLQLSTFKNNVRTQFIAEYQRVFRCASQEPVDIFDNYLQPKFDQFPFVVEHYYQLRWFFRFIFRYDDNARSRFRRVTGCSNTVIPFYDTAEFQKWAITNLDNNFDQYSQNYRTYKQFQKQYNHDVFKLDSLLSQNKFPSLPNIIPQ